VEVILRRATVITAVVAVLLLAKQFGAEAQQAAKVHRVGYIATTSPMSELMGAEPVNPPLRALLHGLRALGYVDGKNLILERRSAEGRFERFADIVADLVRLKADVIVTVGTLMTQRAQAVTTAVPIVMGAALDPVGAGLVQSLARPGGNITGVTYAVGPEFEAKRFALLKECVPRAAKVAFLGTRQDWDGSFGESVRVAAQSGSGAVTLFLAEHSPNHYADAFLSIRRGNADALFVAPTPTNYANRQLITEFAALSRLPSVYNLREYVDLGGLMSYGVDVSDLFRRTASYVDKILKGARPAELPVEQPTKFELVVNLRTARTLGLTIPPSLILRADHIVQ
jgi:putative ABC transport system substrate-binding protein